MPQDPLDLLVKIRTMAGQGMWSAAERLTKIEALCRELRSVLESASKATPAPAAPALTEEPAPTRRSRKTPSE